MSTTLLPWGAGFDQRQCETPSASKWAKRMTRRRSAEKSEEFAQLVRFEYTWSRLLDTGHLCSQHRRFRPDPARGHREPEHASLRAAALQFQGGSQMVGELFADRQPDARAAFFAGTARSEELIPQAGWESSAFIRYFDHYLRSGLAKD